MKQELVSGKDMGSVVLRGCHLENRPIARDLLSQAQLLRAGVQLAEAHFGDRWPEFVGIAADVECLDRQLDAPLLCLILYSESHWALLCIGRAEAVIYDGKDNKVTSDHACSFLDHLKLKGRVPWETKLFRACATGAKGRVELRTSCYPLHGCRHGASSKLSGCGGRPLQTGQLRARRLQHRGSHPRWHLHVCICAAHQVSAEKHQV